MSTNKRLQKDFLILKSYIKDTYMLPEAKLFPYIKDNETFDMTFQNNEHFYVVVKGPENSPYEGGEFLFEIKITTDYPFKPPTVICHTKIFHPNINTGGTICVETLQNGWSPTLGLKQMLMSIYAIMFAPNTHSPKTSTITNDDIEKYNKFNEKAMNITHDNKKLII